MSVVFWDRSFIIKAFHFQKILHVALEILYNPTTVFAIMTSLCTLPTLLTGITWEN